MATSKSLTVLTVVSSIFALQACTEGALDGLTLPDGTPVSSEGTNLPVISLGAANPTGTETTIPIVPGTVTNYTVNNYATLPVSSLPSTPDEELDANIAPATDSSEVIGQTPVTDVTDIVAETNPPEVTDIVAETNPPEVTDIAAETAPSEVTDSSPATDEVIVGSVDYTPILETPVEGQLVPYGSIVQFAWSIPVALFGTVTGFDIAIAGVPEGVVSYRNSQVAMTSCSDNGLCTYELNSADLPIPEGENIWSVSSTGADVSFNLAEATFTLDANPEVQTKLSLSMLSPAAGYVADSSSVDFTWEDPSKPDAVYDLHVYGDVARTQLVTGTNGVVFDTSGIGTATSHTFTGDPSDGAKRYGQLWQWDDATYNADSKQVIQFEYTAVKKLTKTGAGGPDYEYVKGLVDNLLLDQNNWYTRFPMRSDDGYFSKGVLVGGAQAYKASGDTAYLVTPLRIGQSWIDSGTDLDGNGKLDWWGWREGVGDLYNYDHHEWRAASGIADVLIELIRTDYEGKKAGRIAEWANFLKVHVWEKWAYPNNLKSAGGQIPVYSIATEGVDFIGRWMLISMALDKAQAAGFIPASNQYADYFTNPSRRPGVFMTNYLNKYGTGQYNVAYWSDGDFRGLPSTDTSHAMELFYSMLRAKQLGYNVGGKMEQFIPFFQAHLDAVWFPTSAGFTGNADGSNGINTWHESNSKGVSLAAALSPALTARWVDLTRNHKPTWTFWSETGYNPPAAMAYGGALMWVLNGGQL